MKVGILVVTYNRLGLLKEVIESLRKQTYTNKSIIVVNNNSTDGTEEWLREQTDITTISQPNSGGAGGFNTGLRYIAENGFDFAWLMDDDVVCHADALNELMSAYNVESNIGFVCSRVVGLDGQPMNVPQIDRRLTANSYPDWCRHLDKQMIKVESATFVSVLVSTETIREVGLPYKEYFIWGDDTEYTTRITRKHTAYMVNKSIVVHKRANQGGVSIFTETDSKRLKNIYFHYRNNTHITFKYGEMKDKLARVFVTTYTILKLLFTIRFAKAWLLMRSQVAALFFSPRVEYPLVPKG